MQTQVIVLFVWEIDMGQEKIQGQGAIYQVGDKVLVSPLAYVCVKGVTRTLVGDERLGVVTEIVRPEKSGHPCLYDVVTSQGLRLRLLSNWIDKCEEGK